MNISLVTVALLVSGASAFAPSSPSLVGRGMASSAVVNKSTSLFSEPAKSKVSSFLCCGLSFSYSFFILTLMLFSISMHPFAKEEEGGLDLDLSEMFDM
jgi:hypothetical protein